MRDLEVFITDLVWFYETMGKYSLFALLTVTSPLWVLPYILYWRWKHKRNEKGGE